MPPRCWAGLRFGLHRQPQPAGMEWTESFSRRRFAVARSRNPADRSGDQCADHITTSSSWNWIWRWRPASSSVSDFTNEYVDAVEALIDLDVIRKAGLKLIVDPMYGVGQLTLGTVLTEARCRVTSSTSGIIRCSAAAQPGARSEALRMLSQRVAAKKLRPGAGDGWRRRPHRHRG